MELLLNDEKWGKRSGEWIAKVVGVSHTFVGALRNSQPLRVEKVVTADGRLVKAKHSKAGSKPKKEPAEEPEPELTAPPAAAPGSGSASA